MPKESAKLRCSGLGYFYIFVAAALLQGCDHLADSLLNSVYGDTEPTIEDQAFHEKLLVADLHSDALLWKRDLIDGTQLIFSEWPLGHVDLVRLRDGNVSLQSFTVATKYPLSLRGCHDRHGWNPIGLLWFLQGRPSETWFDLKARALEQAWELHRFAELSKARAREDPSHPEIVIIKTVDDLKRVIESFMSQRPVVGAWLGIEGAHWLGGSDMSSSQLEIEVEELYEAGFRMIAPTHHFDNDLAGSSEGCTRNGLTFAGRIVLEKAHSLGMIVDLAHASHQTIRDVLDLIPGPFFVSHTGVRSVCKDHESCDSDRNLTDEDIVALARSGGVIGVGYWPQAVGRPGISRAAAAMVHVVEILEDLPEFKDPFQHLAFGSDFDGGVSEPIDASGMAIMTGELRRYTNVNGQPVFSAQAIRKIAGGNVCRVLALRLEGGGQGAVRSICNPVLSGSSNFYGIDEIGETFEVSPPAPIQSE